MTLAPLLAALLMLCVSTNAFGCWAACTKPKEECNADMIKGQLPVVLAFLEANPDFCKDKKPGTYHAGLHGKGSGGVTLSASTDPGSQAYCGEKSAWLRVEYTTDPRRQIFYPIGETAKRCPTEEACPAEIQALLKAPWHNVGGEEYAKAEGDDGEYETEGVDEKGVRVIYFDRRRVPKPDEELVKISIPVLAEKKAETAP